VWKWAVMHGTSSYLIASTSLGVHHTPEAWHEGYPAPLSNDFGMHQVITVVDHSLWLPLPLSYLFFGGFNQHAIHHLFPTLDSSRHQSVQKLFEQSCKDFGVPYKKASFLDLYIGMWIRLRTEGILPDLQL